ncbi:ABC transporter permease [Verrucomicrobiota bacterium]|nr:ABC transporter permease [Verrucomicrobiota bacterium]
MSLWTLILRSLRHHARAHFGVLLGATVGSAVLIGALLVGDSVRGSLRAMALKRLGPINTALTSGDRLFRAELATDLSRGGDSLSPQPGGDRLVRSELASDLRLATAPVLALPGTANSADGTHRANRVHVYGVEEHFWKLAQSTTATAAVPTNGVVLNQALADQLATKVGDEVLLRVTKTSALSQEVSLTPRDGQTVALRLRVTAIQPARFLGNFSLQANQIAPFNAFVNFALLQERVGATGRANLMLRGESSSAPKTSEDSNYALPQIWKLADTQLELRPLTNTAAIELRTPRIFLDPPAVRAALAVDTNARPVLTFLVNLLRAGERTTPYSMVTAATAPLVPADLRDDEIVISQWLADDLKIGPGAEVALTYFLPDSGARLLEATNRFRVRSVVPLELPWADRTLMPDFPGIAQAERAGDWDAGFPLAHKIRKEDDDYWAKWRGTPKAFVTLNAGRKMWANRFGDTTAVRFAQGTGDRSQEAGAGSQPSGGGDRNLKSEISNLKLEAALLAQLKPADFGLTFQPVRAQALAASSQGQDFGGLFIGFSFFLIIAACVLVALLFQFGIEQRAQEIGTLLALGFTPPQVRRLLLGEGAGLALLGALLGAAGAVWYARAMLHALSTVWRDAVGTSDLHFHAEPATLFGGIIGSVLVAVFTLWLALRKQVQRPARELLAGGSEESDGSRRREEADRGTSGAVRLLTSAATSGTRAALVGLASLLSGLGLVGYALATAQTSAAGLFFGAGALLLIAALAFTSVLLSRLESSATAARLTLAGMGLRSATRRRRRSLATVAMLACGSFLIVSIGAFRLDENVNSTKRSSGTGGFAFLGESTLPVTADLNTARGRESLGLPATALTNVSVVPFRVRDGDDASCLNLNRAQKPRLLGVKPELLAGRGAFSFASVAKGLSKENPWLLLSPATGSNAGTGDASNEIPGIADEASILWALGKKLGDTLDFTDERGQTFRVRLVAALANSVLQGNIIIAEEAFTARFPGESGYRFFLVDSPPERASDAGAQLTRALRDSGLELTPATRRLAQFNAVQNTYLGTFQVLGGLGLLLGSVGLGVVVLRNVLERRGELALLLAVGFRPRSLKWLLVSEHGALLLIGLGGGVAAAVVAVLPALMTPNTPLPIATLSLTLGGVLLNGALWTLAATALALRGNLLDALRNN